MKKLTNDVRQSRRGVTLILISFLMVVLIIFIAIVVDLGRMYLVKNQMQSAVDAGALAASLQLKRDGSDTDAAKAAGEAFVKMNNVGSLVSVPDDSITVEVGTWNAATKTFTEGGVNADTVRVRGQMSNEPFFFAKVFGHTNFAMPRDAIANGGGRPLDIMMTLDLSGSMGRNGRIQALRDAAPEFVNVIEDVGDDDQIGVMGYGAIPGKYDPSSKGHSGALYTDAPSGLYPAGSNWVGVLEADLTSNFSNLRNNVLDSGTLVHNKYNGWTPTGAALRDSIDYLVVNGRNEANKVIVLMSDGRANKPNGNGPGYARDMAAYAAGLEIAVYTISLGNGADESLMQDIADATEGEHFVAVGNDQAELSQKLTDAFRGIAETIKRTQLVQ